mmetsp:Transcript_35092/g.56228  ORF Transcript_35092/g.56228 Transcript_35092/m.56228 type:complete len:201 (+) Transcript_35092:459-1061(+)
MKCGIVDQADGEALAGLDTLGHDGLHQAARALNLNLLASFAALRHRDEQLARAQVHLKSVSRLSAFRDDGPHVLAIGIKKQLIASFFVLRHCQQKARGLGRWWKGHVKLISRTLPFRNHGFQIVAVRPQENNLIAWFLPFWHLHSGLAGRCLSGLRHLDEDGELLPGVLVLGHLGLQLLTAGRCEIHGLPWPTIFRHLHP